MVVGLLTARGGRFHRQGRHAAGGGQDRRVRWGHVPVERVVAGTVTGTYKSVKSNSSFKK